jgi:transposase-like protein
MMAAGRPAVKGKRARRATRCRARGELQRLKEFERGNRELERASEILREVSAYLARRNLAAE